MTPAELLTDALSRIADGVEGLLDGLSDDDLAHRPTPDANSIAWLVWHLARVQDDHVADVSGLEQVYTAQGYADRFGLPFGDRAIGYGQSSAEVAEVRAPADLLLEYLRAVHAQTVGWLGALGETTSTGSSTSAGIRRSRWASGWSASPTTAPSTSARRRT